jgi:ATP phosphoribosyltransferase
MSYTLQDYQQIQTLFVLPDSVMEIISTLSARFGVAQFIESKPKRHQRGTDTWKNDFKPTAVLGKIGDKMNEMRVSLNKLSVKNYEITSEFIVNKMKELNSEEIQSFMTIFMDVISTNKMFSSLYSKIYKKIVEDFPDIFSQTLDSILKTYSDSISNIRWVDQKDNYDEFCKNNKENDKRKTIAAFITQLYEAGLVSADTIFSITDAFFTFVREYSKEENKIYEVEEITENIYVLLTQQKELLMNIPKTIYEKIVELSQKKAKEDPSISSRAIFKYIDIIEKIDSNRG